SSRTVAARIEDAQAIRQRSGAYNYVHDVDGMTGWFYCSRANIPYSSGNLRDFELSGQWLDESVYTVRQHCRSLTRPNDWSISGDNWVAVPIGADWSGGSTTESLSTEDGNMIRVQSDIVQFDLSATERNVGECRVYDGSTEIFNREHIFSGNTVISNGRYKVTLSSNTITIHYWNGSVYIKIDDFDAGTFDRVHMTQLTPDVVRCKTNNSIEITLERGRVPMLETPVDLTCSGLTPSNQSTSTDNYLTLGTNMYVASDRNFSIASNVIDSGNIWIFYDSATEQTTAHNALVISNLKREVVER
ncbi:MAG: hypothetical protein ACXQTE_03875, partial [Methanosarcinaceae archaeon]